MGRVEDSKILEEPKMNRVFGRPLEEPLNASECASLAEPLPPQNPAAATCSDFQLWRTLLEFACTCLSRGMQKQEILGQMQVSTGTATIVHESFIVARVVAALHAVMRAPVGGP